MNIFDWFCGFFKPESFINRLLGSSCEIEELRPKGDTPAKNDFRKCKKCGKSVLAIKSDFIYEWTKPKKSCGCSFLCIHNDRILKDGSHMYKIPRLYDYVIWRPIVTAIVVTAIGLPIVVDWHGFDNVFIPETYNMTNVLQFYTGELKGQFMTIEHEFVIALFLFLPILIAGILVQLFSNGFKPEPEKGVSLLLFVIILLVVSIHAPTHVETIKGEVVSKSEAMHWADQKLSEEFDSLVAKGMGTESHKKAFAMADEIVKKANYNISAWEVRRAKVATMLVKAYPTKLENYWNVLKGTNGFNELYLGYLKFPLTKSSEVERHCQIDPWNIFSIETDESFVSAVREFCKKDKEKSYLQRGF